jgi:hypothetical protein
MGFHPITGWFGINNVIGRVLFNFLLISLGGCGMDIKLLDLGISGSRLNFFVISRPNMYSRQVQGVT